jgi:hypothetical protein
MAREKTQADKIMASGTFLQNQIGTGFAAKQAF